MNPTTQQQIEDLTPGTVFTIASHAERPDAQQDFYVRLAGERLFWFNGDGEHYEEIDIADSAHVTEGNDENIVVVA